MVIRGAGEPRSERSPMSWLYSIDKSGRVDFTAGRGVDEPRQRSQVLTTEIGPHLSTARLEHQAVTQGHAPGVRRGVGRGAAGRGDVQARPPQWMLATLDNAAEQ